MGRYGLDKEQILEGLQFLAGSGWRIFKGGMPLEKLIAKCDGPEDNLQIAPVFNNFHDDIDLSFDSKYKMHASPAGDLKYLIQSPDEIQFNLGGPSLGASLARYEVYRKTDHRNPFLESVREKGFSFEYDNKKRMFKPIKDIKFEKFPTVKEQFYNGEFLESFAKSLVIERYGNVRTDNKKMKRYYSFSHIDFHNVTATIRWPDLCLLGSGRGHEVVLEGPKNQVEKFREGAQNLLEKTTYSFNGIERQLKEKVPMKT